MTKRLIIIGAGGYGPELAWLADDINGVFPGTWDLLGYCDQAAGNLPAMIYDRPVLGTLVDVVKRFGADPDIHVAIGIGSPKRRQAARDELAALCRWTPATMVHPTAVIARDAHFEPGVIVGAGCVIGPGASLGSNTALNVAVGVGHQARVGECCMFSPGARISGQTVIGDRVMVGANAVIAPRVHVESEAVVGALAFVVRKVEMGKTAVGNPARTFSS
jgi:sugar O-acyltransferase (sialic acid O-acetyltransferase NeuD family)